jgi:hemin uptake protein HemP
MMEEKRTIFDPERSSPSGVEPITPADKKPRIESSHLFQGEREIVIVHQTKEYSLRITRNGKLILTK